MSDQKKYTYIAAGIIVLILVAWAIYAYNHQNTGSQTSSTQNQENTASTQSATSTPTSTPVTIPSNKLSYGAAIKAYYERFLFSNVCQGTPASISVRKGSPVMLDNRNATAITVKADTETFRLAGFNYDVFYPEVLGNLTVTCNGKNSVTLN